MSTQAVSSWHVRHESGSAASQVIIELRPPTSPEERDRLLTRGVAEAMTALLQAYRSGQPVVLDLRVATEMEPGTEAYIEAVRGLVQSLVLETPVPVLPVNVLVTTAGQDEDRARTLGYLSAQEGTFSCGATYDLREGLS